jgi:hypothetical protein
VLAPRTKTLQYRPHLISAKRETVAHLAGLIRPSPAPMTRSEPEDPRLGADPHLRPAQVSIRRFGDHVRRAVQLRATHLQRRGRRNSIELHPILDFACPSG